MNDIALLRAADPAAGPVPQTGRQTLLTGVRAQTAAPRPASSARPRALTAAVAVFTLVAGSVAWQVIGSGEPGGASPAAAAALEQAATATIGAKDPVVGPRQYLQVSTQSVSAVIMGGSHRPLLAWLVQSTNDLWIPGDASREWVLRGTGSTPYKFFAPGDEARARALGALNTRHTPSLLKAPGGAFYGEQTASWQLPTPTFLAGLPRDPRQLLARIYRDSKGGGQSRDGEALVYIADVLRCGLAPGDLRAALFRAATRIPGVKVIDQQANLNGRVGIAVGRAEGSSELQELIFDQATGSVIGERQVILDGKGTGIPSGQPMDFTAVSTQVVDSAP